MHEIPISQWASGSYPGDQKVLPKEYKAKEGDYGRDPCLESKHTGSERRGLETGNQTTRYSLEDKYLVILL